MAPHISDPKSSDLKSANPSQVCMISVHVASKSEGVISVSITVCIVDLLLLTRPMYRQNCGSRMCYHSVSDISATQVSF